MRLIKAVTAGTTALIHPGPVPPTAAEATAALDPVRGIGADLLVFAGEPVLAYTSTGQIPPPAAALRCAAAYAHHLRPAADWEFTAAGRSAQVRLEQGEYLLDHGPWSFPGGRPATGYDTVVRFTGLVGPRPGLRVRTCGQSVTVSALASAGELASVDFRRAPKADHPSDLIGALTVVGEREVELTDPTGVVIGSQRIGAMQMRGHGPSGEVFSADALAVAAAAAARAWGGPDSAREWVVVFGGGSTRVHLGEGAVAGAEVDLLAEITLW